MWRIMPAISAALLAVSAIAFSLASAEATAGLPAQEFGYAGETVRIVAVQPVDPAGPGRFTRPLLEFAEAHDVSVAYTRYSESGVVGLHDPSLRFRSRSGALFAPLAKAGSKPAAMLSTTVVDLPGAGSGLLGDGITRLGAFRPDFKFDSRYPVVLENLAAAQPGSGVYLLAGLRDERDRMALRLLFSRNGMNVKHLAVQTPVTLGYILSTLYGGIVMAFTALAALASLLVTQIHSLLLRRRLIVAAVLGASASDLRQLLLGRLIPLVAAGTALGALVELGVALSLRHTLQAEPATLARAAAAGLAACILLWVVVLAWVSAWEIRRCRRAVPG